MLAQTRVAIANYLNSPWEADHPSVPMIYDNQAFDWNSAPSEFVECEIKFYSSSQINIQNQPKTRYRGYIYLTAYTKEGLGTVSLLTHLDWLASHLQYQNIDGVQVQNAEPVGPASLKGWFAEEMKFAFWVDEA